MLCYVSVATCWAGRTHWTTSKTTCHTFFKCVVSKHGHILEPGSINKHKLLETLHIAKALADATLEVLEGLLQTIYEWYKGKALLC